MEKDRVQSSLSDVDGVIVVVSCWRLKASCAPVFTATTPSAGAGGADDVMLAPVLQRSCSPISSQWLGQAGHFLQHLVVGVLIVVVRLDQDDAGRPLGARRRSQILGAGGGKVDEGGGPSDPNRPRRANKKPTRQTHHFGGDVGVRQVPVLTHDGQVTVDVDGQSVPSQDHDAANAQTERRVPGGTSGGTPHASAQSGSNKRTAPPTHPFSPLLMNFCTSFTPRRMFFTLAAEEGDTSVVCGSSGGNSREERNVASTSQTMQ